MAYMLGIRKKQELIPIDIKKLSKFVKKSNFKDGYSLDEIDFLTGSYKDEAEFKGDLISNGLLDIKSINQELIIVMKSKDSYKKVMYGLFYQDSFKYLDLNYLRYNLLSKGGDNEFLSKFINHYRNSYNQVIINIISCLMNERKEAHYISERLGEFFYKEIYSFDKKTEKYSIKYKSLHDLAMFIYMYDYNMSLEKSGISPQDKKELVKRELRILKEELSNLSNAESSKKSADIKDLDVKVKKRIKRTTTPLDGQLSFEDFM